MPHRHVITGTLAAQMTAMRCVFPLSALLYCAAANAQVLGSGFTYQGRLTESAQSANGLYDIQVCLFDNPVNPLPLQCAPNFDDVPVESGLFALTLDFGAAPFAGQLRFLELRVRAGASTGGYAILAPRQLIRATPEALRANAASAAPWSGLTGVPSGFADGIDNSGTGTVTSLVAGSGLAGGTITDSGTISIANAGVVLSHVAANAIDSARIVDASVAAVDIADSAIEATQLADNAVDNSAVQDLAITAAKIAAGAVGASQINPAEVQLRVTGICPVNNYLRGLNPDGSVLCEPLPGTLHINTVDDSANSVGAYTDIAIGSDGLPVISYRDATASALKVAKCSNAACTGVATITTVNDPGDVGRFASLAIGSDGRPVISYFDEGALSLKAAKCGNAACTGVPTITTMHVNAPFTTGQFTAIAIGADNRPVSSYSGSMFGLHVAKCGNADCRGGTTLTAVDSPPFEVGQYTAIAIGGDGFPVISYYDVMHGSLRVAKCANAACTGAATLTTVDDPANNVGHHTSIAIGADGLPVISYHDVTAGALKVAKCANAACTGASTITLLEDTANVVGQYTAIAIDPEGMPVISYHDASAGTLKVARCNTAACTAATITTVDDPINNVGAYSAIAIGVDGLPVISYFDSTAGALKVAKCATRSCQ